LPESHPPDGRRPTRSAADRSLDHAAIDRLTTELLPSLVAKLGATGLGEIEVREGAWRVRLRRPADGSGATPATHGRERRPGERPATDRGGDRHADRPRPLHHGGDGSAARTDARNVATSPAVGVFQPRRDLSAGDRVRAGDRLGAVDMLGVAQEVLAPVDGVLGASLVEPGDAVEYGQELLLIETAGAIPSGPADGAA
jgi:biotin carboxyl carrier protein